MSLRGRVHYLPGETTAAGCPVGKKEEKKSVKLCWKSQGSDIYVDINSAADNESDRASVRFSAALAPNFNDLKDLLLMSGFQTPQGELRGLMEAKAGGLF